MIRRPRSSGRPTIRDVAAAAGVSTITVSRALRTPERVSPDTRTRVEAAVRQLDYLPDPAASALASARTDVVGVLVPSVTNTVFLDTLRGIFEMAEAENMRIQIGNTRYSQTEEDRLLRIFLSQKPAALIVTGHDQSDATAALMRRAPCPLVQITEIRPDPHDMMVGFDHGAAARLAAEHLIAAGYRRPAFLGARQDPRSIRRLAGFRAAVAQAGLHDEDRVLFSDTPSTVTLGARQLGELLARDPLADAVLCNNDDLALGVLFECQRRGLRVPDDFGICGFNDLEMMATAFPSLTSVRTPRRRIGRIAMEMIAARLRDPDAEIAAVDLGSELIARDSTRRTAAPAKSA